MLLSAILRGEMGEEEEMARGFAELGIDLRAGEAVLPLLVRLYAPARQGYRLAAVSGYIRRQADGACLCEAVPFGQTNWPAFCRDQGGNWRCNRRWNCGTRRFRAFAVAIRALPWARGR